MGAGSSAARLIKEDPSLRSKKVGELQQIVGRMLVKERIQHFFKLCAREASALREFKQKHGYCPGAPQCMAKASADGGTCRTCREQAAKPQHSNRRSEYGRIRLREKRSTAAKKKSA